MNHNKFRPSLLSLLDVDEYLEEFGYGKGDLDLIDKYIPEKTNSEPTNKVSLEHGTYASKWKATLDPSRRKDLFVKFIARPDYSEAFEEKQNEKCWVILWRLITVIFAIVLKLFAWNKPKDENQREGRVREFILNSVQLFVVPTPVF